MITSVQINEKIVKQFKTLLERGRLAHAYLFIGPSFVGKGETALAIAKEMINEKDIDLTTKPHPDVHIIDNGYKETIKIEEIRAMMAQVKLRPFFAERKVFVIRNIENMTQEGANALLKTLEEPAANSLILLTTSVPERNLDTVKSRCHTIHFTSTSNEKLEQRLTKEFKEDTAQAHFLAYLAEGCLGTALQLKNSNVFDLKNDVIDQFIFNAHCDEYIKEVLADKPLTKQFLDVLLSWVRDAMLVCVGVDDDRLIHLDRLSELKRFAQRFSFDELIELNKEIISMNKMLSENLNIKLPVLIIKERLNG